VANASVYLAQMGTQWTAGRSAASIIADWNAQWAANYPSTPVTVTLVALNSTTNRLDVNLTGTDGVAYPVSLNTNDWVVNCQPMASTAFPSQCSTANQVAAAMGMQQEVAAASIPALVLGGTASVTATFKNSFPNLSYVPKWRAFAGVTVLGTLTATETARTVNSITYTIAAPGLATAAGVLLVDAYSLG
jgi:hypothetical protein